MSMTLQWLHIGTRENYLPPFLPEASAPFTNMDISICLLWFGFSTGNPTLGPGRPCRELNLNWARWNCKATTSIQISFVPPLWLHVANKSQLYRCNSSSLARRQMEIEIFCRYTCISSIQLALSLYVSFTHRKHVSTR